MQVQHSQDIDTLVADNEIRTIGKVPKQRTVHRFFQTRELPGILDDATEHRGRVRRGTSLPNQTAGLHATQRQLGYQVQTEAGSETAGPSVRSTLAQFAINV